MQCAGAAAASISRGVSLAKGNLYARYLVDAPPNVCNPTYLANSAKAIAEKFPDVMSCTVLDKAACEAMNMGCYLGVAAVSPSRPLCNWAGPTGRSCSLSLRIL